MAESPVADPAGSRPFDVETVRAEFPILARTVRSKKPLVYLDNAATAQKPAAVIERLRAYYAQENANIHRGVHTLSEAATLAYEDARKTVAAFLGAPDPAGCIFVRGATEAINLVAQSWGRTNLQRGDRVVLTVMEHHANIVPWQILAGQAGVELDVVPMAVPGVLDREAYAKALERGPKLVALQHVSNALGTVHPVKEMIAAAKAAGAAVLLDGCQSAPHFPVDVADLGADFFVFSGHKVFGPTGIGVLWAEPQTLAAMPPYQGGGDMIEKVSFAGTTFRGPPERFEAGTPHIAGAIGLAAAIEYLQGFDRAELAAAEHALFAYADEQLRAVRGLHMWGEAPERTCALSFELENVHPHDAATVLDMDGIAVRAGHHCCMPLMEALGIPGTLRASLAFYNTRAEVDALVLALDKARAFFA